MTPRPKTHNEKTKAEALERLKKRVLAAIRKTHWLAGAVPVFGSGPVTSPVMLVGEAPGRTETAEGVPFVGRAGAYLRRVVGEVFRDRGVYITNVVKVWPHVKTKRLKTRPPTRAEEAFFLKYLYEEIDIVGPSAIVAVGKTAFSALCPGAEFAPGTWTEGPGGRPVMPVYHPAYILRKQKSLDENTAALVTALKKVRRRTEGAQ